MPAVARPRGPLPARVYWTRRLLVLVVAGALVFGIGRVLTSSPGNDPTDPAAQQAGAPLSPTDGPTSSAPAPRDPGPAPGKKRKKNKKTALPDPTGPCLNSDITATPVVEKAIGGSPVPLALELTTEDALACTWEMSSESLVVKLTSGEDRIWSTQDCPAAVPSREVVVRRDSATTVKVTWSGRRSDEDCNPKLALALPGYYFVTAAALGAAPSEQQFRLVAPPRPVITKTPRPRPDDEADESNEADESGDAAEAPDAERKKRKRQRG